jgi:multiple sugar transport system ATP-binding protein
MDADSEYPASRKEHPVAEISLIDLSKEYADGTKAVSSLGIDIADGEFIVLVGPSGCGKTTALRMVAGLEDITGGRIEIGGRTVNDLPPKDRDIAMVFQNYALYPHMNVYDNMAFGLRRRGVPKQEVDRRVTEAAGILELGDVLKKQPGRLSGGQRQRVAMGRAIVREPQAFLMDEPLSNLDAKLRIQMRAEIARIQRDLGVTTIYVTHDQSEAMTLGDRVAVMRGGFLQQIDTPQVVYDHPENLFVAAFIGSPAMNLLEGRLTRAGGELSLQLGSQSFALDAGVLADVPALEGYVDRPVGVGIRPEDMEDASLDPRGDARLRTAVDIRENMGSEVLVHVAIDAPPVRTEAVRAALHDGDGSGAPAPAFGGTTRIVARVDRESRALEGEPIELAFETRKLRFFDLDSGKAVHAAGVLAAA